MNRGHVPRAAGPHRHVRCRTHGGAASCARARCLVVEVGVGIGRGRLTLAERRITAQRYDLDLFQVFAGGAASAPGPPADLALTFTASSRFPRPHREVEAIGRDVVGHGLGRFPMEVLQGCLHRVAGLAEHSTAFAVLCLHDMGGPDVGGVDLGDGFDVDVVAEKDVAVTCTSSVSV